MSLGFLQERVLLPSSHRHLRGRNTTAISERVLSSGRDPVILDFDTAVLDSFKKGAHAAKQNLPPAVFALVAMFCLSLSYNITMVYDAFEAISRYKLRFGSFFAFFAMGSSIASLNVLLNAVTGKASILSKESLLNFAFLFISFGLMAAAKDQVYDLQAELFGRGHEIVTVLKKVAFDQIVWAMFIACPYQCFIFSWKNNGYSLKKMQLECPTFLDFFALKIIPVLVTTWAFWIPMTCIVYSFPTHLQLIVSIFALSLWVCLLNLLTAKKSSIRD